MKKQRTKFSLRDETPLRHARDFDWSTPTKNPYAKEWQGDIRTKRMLYLFAVLVLAMVGMLLYHPFFRISIVEVTGAQTVSVDQVKESIAAITNKKVLFIFPGNNILLVNKSEIRDILIERFGLEQVQVQNEFPNILYVQLKEKVATVIYDNGKEYMSIGLNGKKIETIRTIGAGEWVEETRVVTSTLADGTEKSETQVLSRRHTPDVGGIMLQVGNFPVIYDTRTNIPTTTADTPVIPDTVVAHVVEWFVLLKEKTSIPFGYIRVEDEFYNATLFTKEGWSVRLNLNEDPTLLFGRLELLLAKTLPRPNFEYVDLRYDERISWK